MKRLISEYKTFLTHLEEIKQYIDSMSQSAQAQKIQTLVSPIGLDESLKNYLIELQKTKTSQIVNNAIIISLYGCFENYVTCLLKNYLNLIIETNNDYSQLPTSLQDKYREALGNYLSNPQRYKGYDLEYRNEIDKYNRFLHSNFNNSINSIFALSHSGNLHMDEIFELMKSLGINNPKGKFLDEPIFKEFYISNGMDESEYSLKRARSISDLFSPIETLINQRNTVAHSWNNTERLTLEEITNTIIPFVDLVCDCLCRICIGESFFFKRIKKTVLRKKVPINIYKKRIICFNNQNKSIRIGDYILLSSESAPEKIYVAKVLHIEVEKIRQKEIDCSLAIDIGIEIDCPINNSFRIRAIVDD